MVLRILILLFWVFVPMRTSIAQSIGRSLDLPPVPTPEAASLIKFVETPVSYFNGIPNINVPLYEIKEKGMSVPITLSYHSNGLKVTEEASWVGLGWSLQAGGMIVQIPMGAHDGGSHACSHFELGTMVPNLYNHENLGNINTDATELYKLNGEQYTTEHLEQLPWLRMDGETDLYMYNFNGYSGKFIKSGGAYYDLTHNKIKFSKSGNHFSVITPDGYRYYFDVTELKRPIGLIDGGLPAMDGCDGYTASTYYLTRIENPNNPDDQINFIYKSFSELYSPYSTSFEPYLTGTYFEPAVDGCVPQMSYYSSYYEHSSQYQGEKKRLSTTFVLPFYLKRIEFSTGYLEFELSARKDLYGFKLDAIKVFNSGEAKAIKSYNLAYDYFTSQENFGSDYFKLSGYGEGYYINYPENYRRKRLKLLSVTEVSPSSSEGKKYQFEYFDGQLPYKSSLSQDYWGYHNGKQNHLSLVPDFRRYLHRLSVPTVFWKWKGANREPDELSMKLGVLKKIIYPTKGWTSFDYEINQYTNLTEQQGLKFEYTTVHAQDVNRVESDLYGGAYRPGVSIKEFVVNNDNTIADISVNLFCNCTSNSCDCDDDQISYDCSGGSGATLLYASLERWDDHTGQWTVFDKWDNSRPELRNCSQGGGGASQYTHVLSAGKYRITANLPDSKPGVPQFIGYPGDKWASIFLTYGELSPYANTENEGGGLRVSKIVNYDPQLGKISERTFSYEGGIMMRFPIFYNRSQVKRWLYAGFAHPSVVDTHYLYSNTAVPYSYAANGSLVGYAQVTEHVAGNGKIVYRYKVRQDKLNYTIQQMYSDPKYISGVPSTSYQDNGLLLLTEYYKEGEFIPLKKVKNFYSEPLAPKVVWNFKTEVVFPEAHNPPPWCGIFQCYTDITPNTRLSFYPINIGKVALIKTIETTNDNNGSFVSEVEYKYDNLDHLQLSRKIQKQSDGSKHVTHFLYPSDYANTTGFIGEMKSANMITKPIEEVLYKTDGYGNNVKILAGKITTYKTGNHVGLPDQNYYIETSRRIPLAVFKFSNREEANILPPSEVNGSFSLSNIDAHYSETADVSYSFDASGNVSQIKARDGSVTSYLWGYGGTKPVGIVINALPKDAFYTSFEEDGIFDNMNSKSGSRIRTSNYSTTLSSLTNGTYRLTYWKRISGIWHPTKTEVQVTNGSYTINITGVSTSSPIDEVRFIPVGAQIITYTYDPIVGITSATDENGSTTYHSYDIFGRLNLIKDNDAAIRKQFEYRYRQY